RDARLGEAVVDALRKSDWFSMSHGGVGAFQWLIVEYEDGREARFRVAEYHRGPGAVLSFGRPPGGSAFHDGYAIARDLPAALARFGLSLEAKRTAASTRGDQRRP